MKRLIQLDRLKCAIRSKQSHRILRDASARRGCMDRFEMGCLLEELLKGCHFMPNRHNAVRRYQIPKMKFSVKNWAEYTAGLGDPSATQLCFRHSDQATYRSPCAAQNHTRLFRSVALRQAQSSIPTTRGVAEGSLPAFFRNPRSRVEPLARIPSCSNLTGSGRSAPEPT